jgi:aromatic-L-amino-acid decarboxylase
MSEPSGHWDAELFRKEGYRIVDWISDYLDGGNRDHPVLSRVEPGEVAGKLPDEMPTTGEDPEAVWQDFLDIILPGVTHWNHPGFMAYFGITGSGPGVLGEMLSAALDVNGMLWRTCPSATELELKVLDWLRRGLGLPENFFGFLNDTASISSLLALAAAREAADPEIRRTGMAGAAFRIYASDQAHSSVAKACVTLGFGLDGFRPVPHAADYRMDTEALTSMIDEDRAAGFEPLAVVATVGTTSTTSVDPCVEIADICTQNRLWMHVDAAYAGSVALNEDYRWCIEGCERADSFNFNPHKWLFAPIDASAFYTCHPDVFKRAFSLVPEYLTTPLSGQVVDLMDYGVQLGRRFRALKLWWILRCFGLDGIRERHSRHIAMAKGFADWIDDDPAFERLAPRPFSVICFRACPEGLSGEELDTLNMELLDHVNSSGEIFLSHTRLDDGIALRVAIGNLGTVETDVARCRELLIEGVECLCRR